ncbi:MAG: MMPL family transporter [Clostridia bacterium]|nr:MMPL family transporter [Clostridia bacterium]
MLKKIANLIVEKRKIVLAVMLALTVVCVGLMTQVEINEDMTKYLSDDSPMKIGMDIMNEEFPAMEQPSYIRVMFTDLKQEEKSQILSALGEIENVASVTYDPESPDYNKDNHTLYTLNIDCAYGGEEEAAIEAALEERFADYEVVWRNGDTSLPDLPLWIAAVAVLMLIIILLIMCGSWIEPILFLAAIGIAIAINMGTNIILGSISSITFSISAILQLVLSMDYSIILINRYRQEKAQISNPVEAMKSALVQAFSSIASSSLTTVVGLLALLFMSFKIGFDLGLVLAKGVALSMVCILTAMPAIILMFDKLIEKTAKKELHVPMGKLASFSYKMRAGVAIFFVFLFVGSYILQGSTAIAYTLTDEDPVAAVFPKENMLVMVYETKDEEAVAKIANDLEKDEKIKSVMGYSTMLAKPCTADEMAQSIKAMAGDMPLDASVFKMLYYTYHTDGKAKNLTAGEMLDFVSKNADNELFASYMDGGEMSGNLSILSAFSDADSLTKPMTADELAKIFGMKSDDIKNLYLYYFTQNGGVSVDKMTLAVFADFVINEVAKDKTYGSMFDKETLSQLSQLQLFADANKMTKPCTAKEFASMLGIEEEMAKMLFAYYFASQPDYNPDPITVSEFASLAIELSENPAFSAYFNDETASQIKMLSALQPLLKGSLGSKQLSCDELAKLLSMDAEMLKILYAINEADEKAGEWKASVYSLMNFLGENKELVSAMADPSSAEMMTTAQKLVNASVKSTAFTPDGLAELTGMEPSQAQQLYVLYTSLHGDTSSWKMSIQDFLSFINTHVLTNDAFSSQFDENTAKLLPAAETLVDAVISGESYSPKDMAQMFDGISEDINENTISLMYLYYAGVNNSDEKWTMTTESLFNHLVNNVLKDSRFEQVLNEEMRAALADAEKQLTDGKAQLVSPKYSRLVISSVYSDESEETTQFLSDLSERCEKELSGEVYLIGNSAMSYEMQQSFDKELLFITLLTALAIFVVVAIAFRSLSIPAILVFLVQCGVYVTVSIIGLRGISIYFLALLIVECILMGATIDYGILFTNYYVENRKKMGVKEALDAAYKGSSHTILTSGLIMIIITAIVGNFFGNPTIGQICTTVSIGCLSATVLILFILPGLLAAFDKIVIKKEKKKK